MAEAVVSFAVERLGDLLISEAKFLSGVKDKILEIQRQLKEMQDFLKDADNKRGNHREVGRWVAEIRELALQTEDVLETYAVKVASRREGGHMKKIMRRFACIIGECMTLHKIGSEIGTIQAKIKNLTTRREKLGIIKELRDQLVESSTEEEAVRRQQRIAYADLIEKDFVGMEEEIKELVSHLIKEDRGCKVVSVWGMGGQGKTTLVRKVFRLLEEEDNKDRRFEAFAWVCITQKLERKEVLQNILQGLLPTMNKAEIAAMGDPILVRELFKTLKNLKCLVVIDDIWSVSDWELLKNGAFPIDDETSSSKILLTTRDETVAKVGSPHKLRPLTLEEGLELFFKKVFPRRDDEIKLREEREKLGKEMVEQCQGLPLAISVLGGILKDKNWPNEWDEVKQNIDSNLSRGKGIANVRYILGLSYKYLPFHLKQLFLYLGTFKEDEEIECVQLYLLWIAEGMVRSDQKKEREMLMDVAEQYLVKLAQRSLIHLKLNESFWNFTPNPWLKVQSCRLHDLIRDLCLSEGEKEDFLKKIDLRDAHNDDVVNGMKARRLAIYVNDDADKVFNIALEQHMVGQLRSLLFFKQHWFEQNISILKDLKLVRVLKLDKLTLTKSELSRGIIELIHLRYLSLRCCKLEELPSCIGDLRYLETLDLRWVKGIIPDVLWKMKRLKHLYLPDNIGEVNKKLRFEGLKELELLENFDASKCDGNDLKKLTNLQVLLNARTNTLQEQAGMMEFLNSDDFRPRYTSLEIVGNYDLDLIQLIVCQNLNELCISKGSICMIPRRDEQLRLSQSLASISLPNCNIEAEALVLLGKLPNLQSLTLMNSSIAGNFGCTAKSFPELIRLDLFEVENLENWTVDDGAMPKLFELKIWNCKNLEMFPEGLKYLTSLQELKIWGMPEAFNDRVREGGQDIHKVDHIRNKLIGDQVSALDFIM